MKRVIVLSLLASLCLVGGGAAVQASPDPSDQSRGLAVAARVFESGSPERAYRNLEPSDRRSMDDVMLPATVTTHRIPTRLAQGAYSQNPMDLVTQKDDGAFKRRIRGKVHRCWRASAMWESKARAGTTLATWWQATEVCRRKGEVRRVYVPRRLAGSESRTPFWSRKGAQRSAHNVSWEGRGLYRANYRIGIDNPHVPIYADQVLCGQLRLNVKRGYRSISESCNLS